MESLLTTTNILFTITVLGVLFAIYRSYRDPQTKSETVDAVTNERITALALKVEKMISNDLPHIDAKVEVIRMEVQSLSISFARLETKIDERLPKHAGNSI